MADLTNRIATIFCYYNTDTVCCLFCDLALTHIRCNFLGRTYATCQYINFPFDSLVINLIIYYPMSYTLQLLVYKML